MCKFIQQGDCVRGPACAWAHSVEELEEITKYVVKLREEKFQIRKDTRTQGANTFGL